MNNTQKKNWLLESNRGKHLVGVFLVSLIGTILMGVGVICGMEFKDCHHSSGNASKPLREWVWDAWDWKDVWAGLIGGVLGQALQIALLLLIRSIL